MPDLAILPFGEPADAAKENTRTVKRFVKRGLRLITGVHCRAIVHQEFRSPVPVHPEFSTRIDLFGQVRTRYLSASYGAHDRAAMLAAVEKLALSVRFTDE